MGTADLERRLIRIEGVLGVIAREIDVQNEERDLDGEIQKAYRRGYQAGRAAKRRGDSIPVDEAVQRQRKRRAER